MKDRTIEKNMLEGMITDICKGNPGALRVLMELAQYESLALQSVYLAMKMTNSDSSALWVAYKDACNMDIKQTSTLLLEWVDDHVLMRNSLAAKPLEVYLQEKGYR